MKKKLFDNRFGGEIGNNQYLSITCFNGVLRKCYFDKANFEGYLNNFKNYILCNEFQVNELCQYFSHFSFFLPEDNHILGIQTDSRWLSLVPLNQK